MLGQQRLGNAGRRIRAQHQEVLLPPRHDLDDKRALLPVHARQVREALAVPLDPGHRSAADGDHAQPHHGVGVSGARVVRRLGSLPAVHGVGEGEHLDPALVGLLDRQRLRIRRPEGPVEAVHLLLGHELGRPVRERGGGAVGELAGRARAVGVHEPDLAGSHERDQGVIRRELGVEGPARPDRQRVAAATARHLDAEDLVAERHQREAAVVRELEAGDAPGGHPHPLALRSLLARQVGLAAAEQRFGGRQHPVGAGGQVERVQFADVAARAAQQEQRRLAVRRDLHRGGLAQAVTAGGDVGLERRVVDQLLEGGKWLDGTQPGAGRDRQAQSGASVTRFIGDLPIRLFRSLRGSGAHGRPGLSACAGRSTGPPPPPRRRRSRHPKRGRSA